MSEWWHRRSVRLVGLGAGASLLTIGLASCQLLSTTVTSVTGTYEPYDPALGDEAIPAEQVDFTISGYTSGEIVCLVEAIDNSGQRVGSTIADLSPAATGDGTVDGSVIVDITGNIFDGTSSNAVVHCATKG
jgi:hypothetical protein